MAMLAVVKAGGAIVPLETMHPRARLESIMRAIDATVVLCSPDQQEWLSKSHSKVVVVDSSVDLLQNQSRQFLDARLFPVLSTSFSRVDLLDFQKAW